MKDEQVPQDDANLLQGKFKKLYYATDSKDHYTQVRSVGWEPENIVLMQAWEEINKKIEAARTRVLEGKASILLYHMERNQMDTSILAGYVGMPAWMVGLHMRPLFFNMLGLKTLDRYAYAFKMKTEDMIDINKIKSA